MRHSLDVCRPRRIVVGSGVLALAIQAAASAALPVVGGPTYSTTAGGHQLQSVVGVTNAGVAVQNTTYDSGDNAPDGDRAVRWDRTGAFQVLSPIGTPNADYGEKAVDIASDGTIVGQTDNFSGPFVTASRPVRWSAITLAPIELGVPGGDPNNGGFLEPRTINGARVSGGTFAKNGPGDVYLGNHPVRWDANGVATELGVLGTENNKGYSSAALNDINFAGVAVGLTNKYNSAGTSVGYATVRWAAGSTTPVELAAPTADYYYNIPKQINNSGIVIGTGTPHSPLGVTTAIRWDANGTPTLLGGLGTSSSGGALNSAVAINASGMIAGVDAKYSAAHVSLGNRAVRWAAGSSTAIELGNLGTQTNGVTTTTALGMNDAGTVAGSASAYTANGVDAGGERAVVWLADNVAVNLNTLISSSVNWNLKRATHISNTGWVAGEAAYDPDGAGNAAPYARGFLLLVPKAGTYGKGDANFDEKVGFDDLVLLAQNYGKANAAFSSAVADLNLDGTTDFNDLVALAQNYGLAATSPTVTAAFAALASANPSFAIDWALAQSLVPEPATFVFACGVLVHAARRRRSHGFMERNDE